MRIKIPQKRRRIHIVKNKMGFNKKRNLIPIYKETVNYYLKYWEMYYENEYVLAKIKETVYEIDSMQTHLEKLDEIKQKEV
jgi:hypothetical protein